MSFAFKEQVGVLAIAVFNVIFIYPEVKRMYRRFYSLNLHPSDPSHYVSSIAKSNSVMCTGVFGHIPRWEGHREA